MKTLVTDDDGNEREMEIPNKIEICFKTPDCVDQAVRYLGLPDVIDLREVSEEYQEKLRKWIEFNELVTIEFDVEKMTARVVER